MKKGNKVRVLCDNSIGVITKVIMASDGSPFKIYVKHENIRISFMYHVSGVELLII